MNKRKANRSISSTAAQQPDGSLVSQSTSVISPDLIIGPLTDLPHMPLSACQIPDWDDLIQEVAKQGVLLVTHHDHPEAVLLSIDGYKMLARMAQCELARRAEQLDELNGRFDKKLACLKTPEARHALDAFMDDSVILGGQVLAKTSY
jgi:PHD/YefM family antitoxin component YafN of YafNO toxin-antitoxin module